MATVKITIMFLLKKDVKYPIKINTAMNPNSPATEKNSKSTMAKKKMKYNRNRLFNTA